MLKGYDHRYGYVIINTREYSNIKHTFFKIMALIIIETIL